MPSYAVEPATKDNFRVEFDRTRRYLLWWYFAMFVPTYVMLIYLIIRIG